MFGIGSHNLPSYVSRRSHELANVIVNRFANNPEQMSASPLTAAEVAEASDLIFRRTSAPSGEYVFSPSSEVEDVGTDYPRLQVNQSLRSEVLAMGRRLAAHPNVQAAIIDDVLQQGGSSSQQLADDSTAERSGRGLGQLVDMLDSNEAEEYGVRTESRQMSRVLDRQGIPDHSSSTSDNDIHISRTGGQFDTDVSPRRDQGFGMEVDGRAAFESKTQANSPNSTQASCTCSCCREKYSVQSDDAGRGTCWENVLEEYTCDICVDVPVGVHVVDQCGHHFCGECIERWMNNTQPSECPVCRAPMGKLVPVRIIDQVIKKAVDGAAPGSERDLWYHRRDARENALRQRRLEKEQAQILAMSVAVNVAIPHTAAEVARELPQDIPHEESDDVRGSSGGHSFGHRLQRLQVVVAVAVVIVLTALRVKGGIRASAR